MKYLIPLLLVMLPLSVYSQAKYPELQVRKPPVWPTPQEYKERSANADSTQDTEQLVASEVPAEESPSALESGYTIQLGAFRDATAAQVMAEGIAVPGVLIQRTLRNGETWYLVCLGAYPGKADAREARDQYLQAHPGADTWIRPIPVESD